MLSVSGSLDGFGMTKDELKELLNTKIDKKLSERLTAQVQKTWYELESEFIVGESKY